MPTAVQVAGLDPDGPAHRAGIQPGDLLVAADDQWMPQPLESSVVLALGS